MDHTKGPYSRLLCTENLAREIDRVLAEIHQRQAVSRRRVSFKIADRVRISQNSAFRKR
jgi:hypothetical protein